MISAPSSYIAVDSCFALDRVVERRRVVADVLDEHLDLGVDLRGAGLVPRLELLDQRARLAAEEPDRLALALEHRGRADEERTLLLLEGVVATFGIASASLRETARGAAGRVPVHDHEARVRVVRGDRVDPRREREPDTDHQVEAGVRQGLHVLVTVRARGVRLVRDDVVLAHEAVGDRLLEPGVRGVVERLVARDRRCRTPSRPGCPRCIRRRRSLAVPPVPPVSSPSSSPHAAATIDSTPMRTSIFARHERMLPPPIRWAPPYKGARP